VGPCRSAVETKLPQAEIIADRFHVTKHLHEAIAMPAHFAGESRQGIIKAEPFHRPGFYFFTW